jgi:hypothetical protein
MGTGNTGTYLSSRDTNTYLSHDGGVNWFEILNGSHVYEIGDHGGIIVMATDTKPTNKVLFSWD